MVGGQAYRKSSFSKIKLPLTGFTGRVGPVVGGGGQALASDLALAAFHGEETNTWFREEKAAERRREKYEFDLPEDGRGLTLQAYFGFVSANGKESSDSVYVGAVVVEK